MITIVPSPRESLEISKRDGKVWVGIGDVHLQLCWGFELPDIIARLQKLERQAQQDAADRRFDNEVQ